MPDRDDLVRQAQQALEAFRSEHPDLMPNETLKGWARKTLPKQLVQLIELCDEYEVSADEILGMTPRQWRQTSARDTD